MTLLFSVLQGIQNSCLLRNPYYHSLHCHDQIQQHHHQQLTLNHYNCYHTHLHLYKNNNQNGNCCPQTLASGFWLILYPGSSHSDRTSLCSSSSRSSCTSSNGSASKYQLTDYSITKPAQAELSHDSWYDTPKNVNQIISSEVIQSKNAVCTCKTSIGQEGKSAVNGNGKVSSQTTTDSNYVNCELLPFGKDKNLNVSKTVDSLILEGHYQVPRSLIANLTIEEKGEPPTGRN